MPVIYYTYYDNTSGSVPTDNTAYTSGQSVTVAGNTGNLAKTGYAFGGWNTQADGQGTNYAANATFIITANTTLYAKWDVNETPEITVTAGNPVNVAAEGDFGELALAYANFTINEASDFAVQFYDSNDEEISDPDWIDVAVEAADPSGYKVSYEVEENDVSSARSAYFKVWALDDNTDPVYSNKVTITQAAGHITVHTIQKAWDAFICQLRR